MKSTLTIDEAISLLYKKEIRRETFATCEVEDIAAMLRELKRLQEPQKLRPMETAPRDGTAILALFTHKEFAIVKWGERTSKWQPYASHSKDFTGWLPLPTVKGDIEK